MNQKKSTLGVAQLKPAPLDAQKAHVLARLRAYGPAFDYQLQTECGVEIPDPAAVIESLIADGYYFETFSCWRQAYPNAPAHEASLRVMFVRQLDSGEVVPTPVQPGAGATDELWRLRSPAIGRRQ